MPMDGFEKKLEKYAHLVIKVGINLQKGQTLVIMAPITAAQFARLLMKKAFEAGGGNVIIDWHDDEATLIKYLYAPDEAIAQYPQWKAQGYEEMAAQGAAFLSITGTNPDLFKEVSSQRIAVANRASAQAMQGFRRYTFNGLVSRCIAAVPTVEWAKKVFPQYGEEEAMEALWNQIFAITRADQGDPIQAWNDHIQSLERRLNYLNTIKFSQMHFKGEGTDLTLGLHPAHLWVGGGLRNQEGVFHVPNIPTEEVFTLPIKDSLEGRVTSTKPLNYGGQLIKNFTLVFEKGRVVDFSAEEGYDALKTIIETDEGSHYVGEVALVAEDSPVAKSKVIFYNTLFDENASVHLALGNAYPLCLERGSSLSPEEAKAHGMNTSLTHVDFMIGSEAMDIDGITSQGERIPIFRGGKWVI